MKTIISMLLVVVLSVGCTYPLKVTNANKVLNPVLPPVFNPVKVGFAPVGTDNLLDAAVDEALHDAALLTSKKNYVPSVDFQPDFVCSLSRETKYKAHGQNFLIACPGFIVFTHAIVGYKYTAHIQTKSTLRDYESNVVSEVNVVTPVEFRHCSFPRGAAPALCGWLLPGYGACAVIPGAIFALSPDKRATPEFVRKVERPYGRYLASRIVEQLSQAQSLKAEPRIACLETQEPTVVVEGEATSQNPPASDEYAVYFMRVQGNQVGEPEISVRKLSDSDRRAMDFMSRTHLMPDQGSMENLLVSLGASPSEFYGQVGAIKVLTQVDEEIIPLRQADAGPTPLL